MKSKFYIEYHNAKDENDNPIADTFHITKRHLVSFLRKLAAAGRRIVYLQELEGNGRVYINKRNVQFINSAK